MKKMDLFLRKISGRQDIILAAILFMAVFMMILPLPLLLVDILIAVNIAMSVTLLMMAIYINEPMEFSSFPAVLLITTLYRLALTISTCRLILLQHDAGEIIYTFGNFAVGGNLAVGVIVFTIITIVQFIVITKGSERVAEVSARFSLDGMPGKQMSIDGDMRAGMMDAAEAKRQRALVQQESQLYGAMDGAMKFVKGDAIASIIVILVNIVGGIVVGVFMHDMSASEAAETYVILSVGDGLVTQIPALLISISAGIIVTRVPGEVRTNLATELSAQILRQRDALWIVAGVLVIFSAFPGFPTSVFLGLAAILATVVYFVSSKYDDKIPTGLNGLTDDQSGRLISPDIGAVPLMLCINKERMGSTEIKNGLKSLCAKKLQEMGLPVPEIHLINDSRLHVHETVFLLYQEPVLRVRSEESWLLLDLNSHEYPHTIQQDALPGNIRLQWAEESQAALLDAAGIKYYRGHEIILYLVSVILDRYAAELIGVQEARYLMDQMESRYGELVRELQRLLPVSRIADVLQRLIAEGVSVRDLRAIFEALVEWAPREKDTLMLAEYSRLALRRHIVGRHRNGQPWINGWVIGNRIEEMLRESARQTSAGSYSALSQDVSNQILENIQRTLREHRAAGGVLVTAIDVRRYLRKLTEKEFFSLPVLSFQEIDDETELKILGYIDLKGEHYATT